MSLPTELLSSRYKNQDSSTREDLEINDYINNKEFETLLISQYRSYNNLNVNVLYEFNIDDIGLDLSIIREFLAYINSHIIPIPDYNGDHPDYQLKFLFRVVYELLFIDLPAKIASNEIKVVDDPTEQKKILYDHYSTLYNILIDATDDETYIVFKYGFIIKILDNNLEDLSIHLHRLNNLIN